MRATLSTQRAMASLRRSAAGAALALCGLLAAAPASAAQTHGTKSTPSAKSTPSTKGTTGSAAPAATTTPRPGLYPVPGAPGQQEFRYPSRDGSLSPPSTLRMTSGPGPLMGPGPVVAPPPVQDSPESLDTYTRCRDDADRAAVTGAEMRAAVGRCLQELNQRRMQGG